MIIVYVVGALWGLCGLYSGYQFGKYTWTSADESSGGVMGGLPGMFQKYVLTVPFALLGFVMGPTGIWLWRLN